MCTLGDAADVNPVIKFLQHLDAEIFVINILFKVYNPMMAT
jgi:hypothetical protein